MIWLNLIIFSAIIFGISVIMRKVLNKKMPPDDILFFLFFGVILLATYFYIKKINLLKKNLKNTI